MEILLYITILMFSIILHEIAHGWAAYRNGDDLAFREGRLTLNPISHIDIFGSIIVPIFGYMSFGIPFGWAKPVPYRAEVVRQKKYGELEVSAAGVLTNFLLAALAVISFYIISHFGFVNQDIYKALYMVTIVNVMLGAFNLLPFPPADGWHIFVELKKHLKNIFHKISAALSGKKYHEASYINSPYWNSGNSTGHDDFEDKISHMFQNPILMIVAIFVAVQVFGVISPWLMRTVEALFVLQF